MDYEKHYTLLCERAKERELDCYTERHHIIPRCMGGTDEPDNLVYLTPEEHYLAHQLLVKMHPDHSGLAWAALQMTGHQTENRSNNKAYGWLKRRYQKVAKARVGEKNGSFGRSWYHNPETLENVKCVPGDEPNGFIKGRKLKHTKNSKCIICGSDTGSNRRKYCDKHRSEAKAKIQYEHKEMPGFGGRKFSDDELRIALIDNNFVISRAMISLGYKTAAGYTFQRMKKINASVSPRASTPEKG